MRTLLTVFLAVVLPSCSLFGDRTGVSEIWVVSDPDPDAVFVAGSGTIDDYNYYTMRGRRNGTLQLVAYDKSSGAEAWRYGVRGDCNPPIAAPGRIYCPAANLYAFNSSSGALLWTTDLGERLDLIRGTSNGSLVFAGTKEEAFAVNADDGSIRWRTSFNGDGWTGNRLRSFTLSPEGDLLVALEALQGPVNTVYSAAAVIALDPNTGIERWRFVDGGPETNREAGSLTLWEDLVLYADATGQETIAFNRHTRDIAWRVPWTPGYFGPIKAPVVAGGNAYIADGAGAAMAINARTGTVLWRKSLEGGSSSQEVCGAFVFFNQGPVSVIDRATGNRVGWLTDANDRIGQMAVADNVLYVSAEKRVHAFDCGS